jgi:hypothetical protein
MNPGSSGYEGPPIETVVANPDDGSESVSFLLAKVSTFIQFLCLCCRHPKRRHWLCRTFLHSEMIPLETVVEEDFSPAESWGSNIAGSLPLLGEYLAHCNRYLR